jgi:hypothetical protein
MKQIIKTSAGLSFIGTLFDLPDTKLNIMKELLQRIGEAKENTHEGFHIGGTIMVVLLFLAFMATSFYLMVTNY